MSYVDGFVAAVPGGNKGAYEKMAGEAWSIFEKYGALHMTECWGDDVPDGKLTDFKRAVQAKPDETVVFSWVVWPSKQVRDAAHQKMQQDMEMKPEDMPFDGKRMIFGGFNVLVDKEAGSA